jgi:flavin reductase (DIM6/NTAB) family NADH-FMN oxidoreductase RutF
MSKVELKTGLDFILLPRPVVLVTCLDAEGKPNIITLAWATPVSHKPLVVAIAVSPKRYSHDLIANSGEFVVNCPDITMGEMSNWCGRKSGRRYDKFEKTGWTVEPSVYIKTPRIAQCYAALECKVINQVVAGDHTTFFGEVVGAFVDENTFATVKQGGPPDKYFNPKIIKTLQHLGGDMYVTNSEDWVEYEVTGQIDV